MIHYKQSRNDSLFHYHYYTTYKLIRNNVARLNRHLKNVIHIVLEKFANEIDKSIIIENAVELIEKM